MEPQPAAMHTALREHLLADHRTIEHQVDQLVTACEAGDQNRALELWTDFEARLIAHLEMEERQIVPLLHGSHARAARAIIEEHKHIRKRVAELGTAIDLHQMRLESLRRFLDELRAHAQTEDRLMYQWADEQLSESAKTGFLEDLAALVRTRLEKHLH